MHPFTALTSFGVMVSFAVQQLSVLHMSVASTAGEQQLAIDSERPWTTCHSTFKQ